MAASMLFVKRGSQISGPYSVAQLQQALASGKLVATDLFSESQAGPWRKEPIIRQQTTTEGGGLTDEDFDQLVRAAKRAPVIPKQHPDEPDTPSVTSQIVAKIREKWTAPRKPRRKHGDELPAGSGGPEFIKQTAVVLALVVLIVFGFFGARYYGERRAADSLAASTQRPMSQQLAQQREAAAASVSVPRRYREKFQDLYDQVKGDLASLDTISRRDGLRVAADLKRKVAAMPSPDSPAIQDINSRLKTAAGSLANALEISYKLIDTEVALKTDDPYAVGGMSQDTRRLHEAVQGGGNKMIQASLAAAADNLRAVENDPLFKKMMR